MSSPPPHPLNNDTQSVEDCRDYLRTGRCKYGGSCKYNHPPNVQNGGGMKVPLNPSEPLFPIRPGEPICQYYMKHGTCKFGQACKFHHPSQGVGQVMNNGQVVMNVVRQSDIATPQLVINPGLADPNAQGVMLQLLPQRPDEPDCIYFLKNGRCKYGATCRYHHPVALLQAQQRIEKTTSRRQPMATIDQQKGQKVHYVTQVLHSYPQGQIILTDNSSPVTFINVDGFNQQGYQVISAIDGVPQYCFPTTSTAVMTEQSSSGSSIASFETANEHMGESAAAHWNRAKRNGSTSNLSSGIVENRSQTRLYIPHVASEGNIIQQNRRSRAASYGSANDNSTYFDHVTGSLPRTVSASSWRSTDRGSGSYDSGQRVQQQQFTVLPDGKVVDIRLRGRPPPVMANTQRRVEPLRRRSSRTGEHDEGFTMMTSALLNMLDTPEETSGENYSEDEFIQSHDDYQRFDNRLVGSSSYGHFSNEQIPPGFNLSSSPPQSTHVSLNKPTSQQLDPTMFQRLSLRPGSFTDDQNGTSETTSSWSPTWQGALSGHVSEDSLKSMRGVLNASHVHTSTPGSAHDSDVGLYLP